jgi:hypothetical protein
VHDAGLSQKLEKTSVAKDVTPAPGYYELNVTPIKPNAARYVETSNHGMNVCVFVVCCVYVCHTYSSVSMYVCKCEHCGCRNVGYNSCYNFANQ